MQRWQTMKSNLFPISNNGFRYIFYAFVASVLFKIFDFELLSFLSFVMLFAIVYFFRNPEREVSIFDAGSVVSPVDGEVVSIEELSDAEYGYKVLVKSGYFDIGLLRAPCDGYITKVSLQNGARLPITTPSAKALNAQLELLFKNEKHNTVKVKHMLTQSFAPLSLSVFQSQSIRQSSRYGFLLKGYTEIYIPKNFRLNINKGNKLKASQSLLGFFIAIP